MLNSLRMKDVSPSGVAAAGPLALALLPAVVGLVGVGMVGCGVVIFGLCGGSGVWCKEGWRDEME